MENAQKELTIKRVFSAPRELVFKAWTDADQLGQWWGPNGFTNPVCRADVRPGGELYIDMTGPDGKVYPMSGTFREIAAPERLVFISSALDDNKQPLFDVLNTVTFKDLGDKTEMTLHAAVCNVTEAAAPYLSGMNEGWAQSLDRLNIFASEPFTIERTYNAPIEKVWSAIADRDEMRKWYFDLAEFRAESGFEFEFTAGDDKMQFRHLCKVTEVIPGRKLTYSWRYDGEPGNSFVSFELFPEGNGTRLQLTHTGLATFPAKPEFAKANFAGGWTHIIGTALKEFLENN